jgi:biotin synthase-like enzyme
VTSKIDIVRKKAELIINNKIYVPKNITLPYPKSRSTAGPSAGSYSLAMTFCNKNIRLNISRNQYERFSLQQNNEKFNIIKNGDLFLENVKILPLFFHSPQQVFLNLDNRCIYKCAFCNLSNQEFLKNYDNKRFVDLIFKALQNKDLQSVSLTSGIFPSNAVIIKKMQFIIKDVREKLPKIPIGVETCISNQQQLILLKKAGATEIKINLQIPEKNLFKQLCPDFHYDQIFKNLEKAVDIFGTGKVTSNILYGLGESNKSIFNAIEKVCKIGVVPTLRKIRINEDNNKKLEDKIQKKVPTLSIERILKISQFHKKILIKNNLTTNTFKTMCHRCGCCDIVPFWDI